MPSSLIIVGLAAAWLAVLVPMVARRRQVITQTNDAALAARVVRSGSAHGASDDEVVRGDADALIDEESIDADDMRDERDAYDHGGYGDDREVFSDDHHDRDEDEESDGYPSRRAPMAEELPVRRYRPGRGGFDPEAAARAARAKYAFRQRVVMILLLIVVTTAVAAGFLLPALWWVHGAADVSLVGYLVYLRRQVRIEEEIRQRRLARLRAASRRAPRRPDPLADIEVLKNEPGDVVGSERKPMPTTRVRRQAVVVDLEDEDPAFHELDAPSRFSYRRAAGE